MTQRSTADEFYFFLGTVAEFIKLTPVMRALRKRGRSFKIIASGQNRIVAPDLFDLAGIDRIDIALNERPIKKSPLGLIVWFAETLVKSVFALRREFAGKRRGATVIVHGDTVSTVMGAFIGRLFGLRVAHVEAGLRSGNFFQPFPEEIDRFLTGFLADVHFCPYAIAVENLAGRRGIKIDTGYNTNIDSLALALEYDEVPAVATAINGAKFFIFIMHRQENLLNLDLVRSTVALIREQTKELTCLFVMHELTRTVLEKNNLLESLTSAPNVILTDRLPYLEFIAILRRSEFIVTDGGGNQQETYYLGKPCFILRRVTEGTEGIGHNMTLGIDPAALRSFVRDYRQYERSMIVPAVRPSEIIINALLGE